MFRALVLVLAVCLADSGHARGVPASPRIKSGDELLSAIVNECFSAYSTTECLKVKVLAYLDNVLGVGEETSRDLDESIYDRVSAIVDNNQFRLSLPFADVTYGSDRGLDVDFPERKSDDRVTAEARGLLKKKLLLPVLLLLKLKMKALMPIFVALIGIKALKALVLSKLAIVLVVGFLVMQLLKKGGMPMPMSMTPAAEPTPPSTAYGPAPAAVPSVATPSDSYGPQAWEPSASGPYSRVWDPTSAHSMAYSSYFPTSSGSSSSSSYSSPSSSASSSSTSSTQ